MRCIVAIGLLTSLSAAAQDAPVVVEQKVERRGFLERINWLEAGLLAAPVGLGHLYLHELSYQPFLLTTHTPNSITLGPGVDYTGNFYVAETWYSPTNSFDNQLMGMMPIFTDLFVFTTIALVDHFVDLPDWLHTALKVWRAWCLIDFFYNSLGVWRPDSQQNGGNNFVSARTELGWSSWAVRLTSAGMAAGMATTFLKW